MCPQNSWHPTPVLLPGKSHVQRSLVGCSPWGCEKSDMTERLHFHFSLSCIGEGNSNPLQCSCLENPRDGGTWWAAVYGVAQSRTLLKRLSSSSSSSPQNSCLPWISECDLSEFWEQDKIQGIGSLMLYEDSRGRNPLTSGSFLARLMEILDLLGFWTPHSSVCLCLHVTTSLCVFSSY